MIVPVVVEGQSLRWYGRIPEIADNSIEFVQLEFRFPEDWDNMVIVAQFTQTKTYNCLLVNNRCFLPMELVAGPCEVSVFGYLNEEVTRGTTIPLKLNISRSGFVSSAETPIPPTPDLYAQLIEYFSSIAGSGGGGSGSGTINPEDIAAAVEDYLSKNPPEVPDLSDEVARAETAAKDAESSQASAQSAMSKAMQYSSSASSSMNSAREAASAAGAGANSAATSASAAEKAAQDAEAAAARAEEAANKVTTDLDTTLTQEGKAADAKAVGDAISKLSGGNVDLTGVVKSVNGVAPDENGNVEITMPVGGEELGGVKNGGNVTINADGTMTAPEGGSVTDEQISEAVKEYLSENPVEVTENMSLYTFLDAYAAWCSGENFSIAFYGDSTFAGTGSGADAAFPVVLQSLLREECGESVTVYNASTAGHTLVNGIGLFDTYFGVNGTYADTKIIFIGYGINDRLSHTSIKSLKEDVYEKLGTIVDKCFARGIQPVIVTSQATLECGVQSNYASDYPLRTAEAVNTACNGAKKELAEKRGIPLIDLNRLTELFLMNSRETVENIIPDRLHFGVLGNEYEAGVMFAHIVPRAIMFEGKNAGAVTYASQKVKSVVPEDKLSFGGSYKVFVNYSKDDTSDMKIMDAYLFVTDFPVTLLATKNSTASATYVKLDGTVYEMSDLFRTLGELDLGLHHLEVYTGESQMVDFCAFGINEELAEPTGITLSASKLTFNAPESQLLTVIFEPANAFGTVKWESSDEMVATVKDGLVTPIMNGTATITAKVGALSAQCAVEVVSMTGWTETASYDIDPETGEVIEGACAVSTAEYITPGYRYSLGVRSGSNPRVYGYTEDGAYVGKLDNNAVYDVEFNIPEWGGIVKIRRTYTPSTNAAVVEQPEPVLVSMWSSRAYSVDSSTGAINTGGSYNITLKKLPVDGGATYRITYPNFAYGRNMGLAEYDENGNFVTLKKTTWSDGVTTHEQVLSENTAFIVGFFYTGSREEDCAGSIEITKVE